MKAAITNGIEEVEIKEVEKPSISSGDILIKTEYAAVCSTDVKIFTGKKKVGYLDFPVILGHEIVGKVVKTGEAHTRFTPGNRVAPYPAFSCGECEQCLTGNQNLCPDMEALGYGHDGGFAEYVKLPEPMFDNARGRVVSVPDDLSSKVASVIEPISCAYNGLTQSRVEPGDSVLVVGLGFMGLVILQMARVFGASHVIGSDPLKERRKKALQVGADLVVDPTEEGWDERITDLTSGTGADDVIAALGAPQVFEDHLQFVKKGGSLNLFGGAATGSEITIDPNVIHYNEIDLVGTSSYKLGHIPDVMNILEGGLIEIEDLITGTYPVEQAEEALASVAENRDIKSLISFD